MNPLEKLGLGIFIESCRRSLTRIQAPEALNMVQGRLEAALVLSNEKPPFEALRRVIIAQT